MIWQDVVVAVANVLFMYSLAHQVRHGFRTRKGTVTLVTSSLTAVGLYAIAAAFFTLSLFLSAGAAFVNGVLWTVLFVQGVMFR